MAQYIDKDALVAELKRRDSLYEEKYRHSDTIDMNYYSAKMGEDTSLLRFLDNLEVKDVDLEKEIDDYMAKEWEGIEEDKHFYDMVKNELSDIARHFFELGLKVAQKGE